MFIPLTPVRFLHRAVDLYGRKTGVICDGRLFTYAEFGARVERLSSGLECLGIRAGDRVAYLSFNNHRLLEGYFGVPHARAVVLPLNVRLSPPELVQILNHSEARLLIFENEFAPLVEKLRLSCPSLETLVAIDEKVPPADMAYEEVIALGHTSRADITAYDESAPAELFYTSGTTGDPKGVVLSHRTIYLHGLDVVACTGLTDDSVELHTIPLFHANGWGRPQAATMTGATQIMVRRFDPGFVFRLIEEHRVTDMSLVPTMAVALLNAPEIRRFDFSSLRLIHIGGAASSPELMERMELAFRCKCHAGYGLTETAPVVSTGRPKITAKPASDAERYARQAMAGLPLPGVEVRVVDAEMRDVPRDMKSVGEVVVRGDHVMDGYFRDPEATSAAIAKDWLRTGDLAVWDEERYVQIVDRRKEIIVSGGENISSLEIEKAILAHPDVLECAAVPAPDDAWGQVPAAIIVRRSDSKLTAAAVLEFLDGRLARFKMPRRIEITETPLPKTGTGKIRKLELRERFWAGRARRV
jgi:fatty-acyl-CoA synthase